jgi:hypothetical protein
MTASRKEAVGVNRRFKPSMHASENPKNSEVSSKARSYPRYLSAGTIYQVQDAIPADATTPQKNRRHSTQHTAAACLP